MFDTDGDGCDDCSSGMYDPIADGPDCDSDGLCDLGDLDDDNDGALDEDDSDDCNMYVCSDTDGLAAMIVRLRVSRMFVMMVLITMKTVYVM